MTRILAIDQGTSATKALVFCTDSGVLAEVDEPVTGLRYDGAAVEQDPDAFVPSWRASPRKSSTSPGP